MDYEETLLQVTDVLKAHNRYHMNAPDHEQAVKAIRDIVTPKGKWIDTGRTWEETVDGFIRYGNVYECSACKAEDIECTPFCGYCGARMER